ncbi:MAG: transporter, partial [Hyphomicrobium sp.]
MTRSSAALKIALIVTLMCSAGAEETRAGEETNTGQDVTNPVQRIDLRLGYSNLARTLEATTLILRYDKPLNLGDGWQLGLRIDAPFVYNDVPSLDNPTGSWEFGYGDTLTQALLIKSIDKRQAVGFGAQLIMPTAAEDQFGSGRWRVVPTFGYRYALPEITLGSFFVGAVRYDTDFAGDDDRGNVSNLQFSPTLNIALPDQI